ncbi:MAG TPA: nucleotidyltransferase domain-containing protein [Gammaproteobacteria bacterium]|nr:nucleotidyltransferase domain-containing protein [Gammaproteobacteria bacterium]
MDKTSESIIVKCLRSHFPGLRMVYLFGSAAADQLRADSDIDIAFLTVHAVNAADIFQISGELATQLKRDVDLVDMKSASTVFRAQIIHTGRRLYCADEYDCDTYADYAFSSYAHLNEERQAILNDIQQRGSVYGG